MGARVQLYALPGLPLHVEDLMPQLLLARCAGALQTHGHETIIFDDGTVDALGDAIDGDFTHLLAHMLDGAPESPARWHKKLFRRHRRRDQAIAQCLKFRIERAVATAGNGMPVPHVAVLFAQRRKDVREIRDLATALKSRWPDLCIAVAGKMPRHYGRQILATCPNIDVACVALPESSVPSLAARWNDPTSWGRIPGLLSRTPTQLYEAPADSSTNIPVNTHPAYHPATYPALLEGAKFNLFTLDQSWGYSHIGHYRDGRRNTLQTRPVRQLRQEMVELHELYGAQTFHVSGHHTPADAVLDFSRECMSLPFPVTYSRDAHVFEVTDANTPALAASGCSALGFALLTGSQISLTDFFGENWSISAAERSLRACRDAGLYLHADFVHPVPPEDYHTRAETIRLLHRCRPESLRTFLPNLLPGSAWHQHAAEFDFGFNLKNLDEWIGAEELEMNKGQEASLLPFTIAGLQGGAIAQRVESFERELEGFGPPIESGCQAGLIARLSGHLGREADFVYALERAAKTLDIEHLQRIVETFNIHATASINTVDFYPVSAAKKVVGN